MQATVDSTNRNAEPGAGRDGVLVGSFREEVIALKGDTKSWTAAQALVASGFTGASPGMLAATRAMPAAISSRPAVVPLLSVTAFRSRSLPIHGWVSTEPSATTLTAAVPAKASMP